MAKKQEKEGESTKKVFNFGDSPLMKKTEQNVVEGYNRIESEEKGGVGKPTEAAAPVQQVEQPAANAAAVAEPEETKGIQLKTKEPLGSMFQQAMQLWIDVQEGKLTVQKV